MKLSEQVITSTQAIKLKELGLKKLSYFAYYSNVVSPEIKLKQFTTKCPNRWENPIPAYSVSELGEMIFKTISRTTVDNSCTLETTYMDNKFYLDTDLNILGNTEAEFRGNLLIYYLDKGWISIEELNKLD